jgi:histidyl-tRNA synthetase
LGDAQCRPVYREKLLDFLRGREASLCANCRRRMERNPLRVLDCKEPRCIEETRAAPSILDWLCAPCSEHFAAVRGFLEKGGLSYALNPRMVRGLDYYCRTTFEWTSDRLGAQNTVGAGGRYDGLVEELGGPAIPGVGFAVGLERLTLLQRRAETAGTAGPALFVAWIGGAARDWAFPLVQRLRRLGIAAEMEGESRSLKSQMRRADKLRAAAVLIVGDDELGRGKAVLRDMAGKRQEEVALGEIEPEMIARKAG